MCQRADEIVTYWRRGARATLNWGIAARLRSIDECNAFETLNIRFDKTHHPSPAIEFHVWKSGDEGRTEVRRQEVRHGSFSLGIEVEIQATSWRKI